MKNAVPSNIDYSSPTLQMNLAVALGLNNPQQCGVVFNRYMIINIDIVMQRNINKFLLMFRIRMILLINRCQYSGDEIMNFLRKSGTSIEIDSEDLEYECNVLFLWTKKNKTVIDTVKRHTSELMDMDPSRG